MRRFINKLEQSLVGDILALLSIIITTVGLLIIYQLLTVTI